MALPINRFEIFDVGKPNVGCKPPSRVRAKITVTLNVRDNIKSEWEGSVCIFTIRWQDWLLILISGLRKHDICFLVSVKPTRTIGSPLDPNCGFVEQIGLMYVRGCEIEGMLDDRGQLIDECMVLGCVICCTISIFLAKFIYYVSSTNSAIFARAHE